MPSDSSTTYPRFLELGRLNGPQREAVIAPPGPLLVLAGAGSGKTRVLTMRIASLISGGADAQRILALTFTNKAAREMRQRLAALVGADTVKGTWMGTFHAIAIRILREHPDELGLKAGFVVFDDEDSRSLVKRALNELKLDSKKHPVADLQTAISRVKADVQRPEDMSTRRAEDRAAREVYEAYRRLCRESNGLDFDDLLLELVLLLEGNEAVRSRWQATFDHVLVDEYQDTNAAQYRLLKVLSGDHSSLTVVGDDDQSIYAFRGANVGNILSFTTDHPRATLVKLEQNYRSTQRILEVAHAVVSRNPGRHEKRLWSENPFGVRPVLLRAPDDDSEAAWVADRILAGTGAGGRTWADFAVLFRANSQARAFEKALVQRRIPYNLVGGLRYWDRREVKDLLSYLRFLHNPSDAVAFDRIANVPKRRISERTAQAAITAAADGGATILEVCGHLGSAGVRADAESALAQFHAEVGTLVVEAQSRPPSQLLPLLLRRCNLYAHYDDGTPGAKNRLANIEQLQSIAADYDRFKKPLERMLTDIALASDTDRLDGGDRVTLITLHMAKGLEWPVVFLTGLEEKTLPHERALAEEGGIDEERRLCYVGMTRAREELCLTTCRVRHVFARTVNLSPSRFLSDIPGELLIVEQPGEEPAEEPAQEPRDGAT